MIRLISIFIIVFLNAALFAQAPDTLWTKTFGDSSSDRGYSVDTTSDGGFIIVGSKIRYNNLLGGVFLIKTDTNGDTLWTKIFGNGYDEGYAIQRTTDNGYIITGIADKELGNNGAFFEGKVLLIKTNENGDTLWMKKFANPLSGDSLNDWGNSVQQTVDGGYIITGVTGLKTLEISSSGGNVWLIKTDGNGDSMWTKTYGHAIPSYRPNGNFAYSVQQTRDGGYIIVGVKWANRIWLLKTNAIGDTSWTKTFKDSLYGQEAYSVRQTSDNGYIIAGSKRGHYPISYDALLIKTNASGDTLWTKTYEDIRRAYSVEQTIDGGYIFSGDSGLIKTDANGNHIWTKTINGVCESVKQIAGGGFIVAGYRDDDVLLVKLAPSISSIGEILPRIAGDFSLRQNYPNPFNPKTTIEFSLPQSEFIILKIYNILGEEVATLVSEKLAAGQYQYNWDAHGFASGVYLYRVQAGDYVEEKKMILLK